MPETKESASPAEAQNERWERQTLDTALADPAYRSADDYAGRNGFSWIHRWSRTKGMAPKGEPDPPQWVTKAFENQR